MFLVISLIIGLYFAYFPLNPLVNLGEKKKLIEIFFPQKKKRKSFDYQKKKKDKV